MKPRRNTRACARTFAALSSLTLTSFFLPTVARAEPRAPLEPLGDPSPPEFSGVERGRERRNRSGLVLRPTFGAGITHIFRNSVTSGGARSTSDDSSLTATPLEFRGFVGGSLRRDLSLGVVIGLSQSAAATFRMNGDASSLESGVQLGFAGLSMLYFFDAGSPWQIGATVAGLDWSASRVDLASDVPHGGGILAGVETGYHVWIGPRWQLGLVGNVDLGATQAAKTFRISEALVKSGETSLLFRVNLGLALSYY